jgi:hypothetical protein
MDMVGPGDVPIGFDAAESCVPARAASGWIVVRRVARLKQIQLLEAWLGFLRLRRLPRRIERTDEGRRLVGAVQRA